MSLVSINYNDGTPEYYSVELLYVDDNKDCEKLFNSRNFVKDWFSAMKFYAQLNDGLAYSSSVGHFISDCGLYDSAWLKFNNKLWELEYEYQSGCLEFFVPKGEKLTWNKLKSLCE